MKKLRVILMGVGNRGTVYAREMTKNPDHFELVAVAEPDEVRRKGFQSQFHLADEMCFTDWEDLLNANIPADVAVITTVDHMHYAPAMKAIDLGYDLLLEKPVAPTARECADILNAAAKKGTRILVCHVLRYTPFYKTVKKLVMEGAVGRVMSVIQVEAIGARHYSHSYVRGNWHKEADSAPMLLAKSCHDLDIIQWILDKPCRKISSFGSLTHFLPENAPEGAPLRCSDGGCPVAETCPYNVERIYLGKKPSKLFRWICAHGFAKGDEPTDKEVRAALKVKNYGVCAFHSDNDVVDHQVVNMEFADGATASLTVNAFNKGGRYIRIFGTKGELYAHMESENITLYTFEDGQTQSIPVTKTDTDMTIGHGGGDAGIVAELYDYFVSDYKGFSAADIDISVKNHLIGFAAEEARRTDTVVEVDTFFRKYGVENT